MNRKFSIDGVYFLVCVLLVFSSYFSAFAQVNVTNNVDQFIADNPGLAFQDFSAANVPPGMSSPNCSDTLTADTNDDCFSPGDIHPGIQFSLIKPFGGFQNVGGENLFPPDNNNPPNVLFSLFNDVHFQIDFSQFVNAAGLTLGCVDVFPEECAGNIIVDVFGVGDVLLGSTNIDVTDLTNSFIGLNSPNRITKLIIRQADQEGVIYDTILNVRFGPNKEPRDVPTISQWGLIFIASLIGIFGYIAIRKRKVAV